MENAKKWIEVPTYVKTALCEDLFDARVAKALLQARKEQSSEYFEYLQKKETEISKRIESINGTYDTHSQHETNDGSWLSDWDVAVLTGASKVKLFSLTDKFYRASATLSKDPQGRLRYVERFGKDYVEHKVEKCLGN